MSDTIITKKVNISDTVFDCFYDPYDVDGLTDRCLNKLKETGALNDLDDDMLDDLTVTLYESIRTLIDNFETLGCVSRFTENVGVTIEGKNLIVGINETINNIKKYTK